MNGEDGLLLLVVGRPLGGGVGWWGWWCPFVCCGLTVGGGAGKGAADGSVAAACCIIIGWRAVLLDVGGVQGEKEAISRDQTFLPKKCGIPCFVANQLMETFYFVYWSPRGERRVEM